MTTLFGRQLLYTFFILISWNAIAQNKASGRFEVEADPIAYLFKGYSLHAGYTFSKYRVSLGTFGIQQPKFLLDNDAFEIFSSGIDLKVDYLFNNINGFFIGAQATYGRDRVGLRNEVERESFYGASFGVRSGYRFMFGREENGYKGLYLVPWIAILYAPDAQDIHMAQEVYRQASFFPFPTVHLGWRF